MDAGRMEKVMSMYKRTERIRDKLSKYSILTSSGVHEKDNPALKATADIVRQSGIQEFPTLDEFVAKVEEVTSEDDNNAVFDAIVEAENTKLRIVEEVLDKMLKGAEKCQMKKSSLN